MTLLHSSNSAMCDDDWVNLAISDDSVVVNLLLLLLHQPPPPPSHHLHLHWTVRQRRSRSVPRNKPQPTTSSTTPLSWSGATSASGGAVDVYEDTRQRKKHAETSRSKISNSNPSETTITKKSKRKKTLAELKEEENLLLREKRSLQNELASLRVTVEKHRATNKSLKRMKHDLQSRQNSKTSITTIQISDKLVSPKTIRHKVLDDDSAVSAANASFKTQEIGNQEYTFEFPDLNLPVQENLSSNTMH